MAPKDPALLVKTITSAKVAPSCVLITGPDEVRRKRVIASILDTFLPSGRDTAFRRLDGRELTVGKIPALRQDLSSISLFTPRKFILLERFDEANAAVTKELQAILTDLPEGVCVLLTGVEAKGAAPLVKKLAAADAWIQLPELKGPEFNRWIQKELKIAGLTAGEDVANAVAAIAQGSADAAARVVERLALYLDDKAATSADVFRLFIEQPDPNEFALIDAITAGNRARAEVLLHQLFAEGKNAFLVLALVSRTFSNYLQIKQLLKAGHSGPEIRQLLGTSPWVFNRQLEAVRRYSLRHLVRIMTDLAATDSRLKNRSLGPEEVTGWLVGRLCAPAR